MSLQFSIDNILGGKLEQSRPVEPAPLPQIPATTSMAPYMRASLSAAAAAAAANYPGSGLAACYSYLYPYVTSAPGIYPSSGESIFSYCCKQKYLNVSYNYCEKKTFFGF